MRQYDHLELNSAQFESPAIFSIFRDEPLPGVDSFAFCGIIDAKAEQLLHDFPAQIESGTVKIDFGKVKRINSMGIALLLRCFKRIREEKKADLQVTNLNQVNMMLFRMTGVFQLARSGDHI
jgi:anti-anti-sigma regulatory factor